MTFTRDAACLRLFYFGQIFSAVAERRFRIPNTPWTTECLIPNDSLSRGIAALAPDLAHPRAGEQVGSYPDEAIPEKLGGVGKMCSFGEGVSMTPLQLGAMVSAIANG